MPLRKECRGRRGRLGKRPVQEAAKRSPAATPAHLKLAPLPVLWGTSVPPGRRCGCPCELATGHMVAPTGSRVKASSCACPSEPSQRRHEGQEGDEDTRWPARSTAPTGRPARDEDSQWPARSPAPTGRPAGCALLLGSEGRSWEKPSKCCPGGHLPPAQPPGLGEALCGTQTGLAPGLPVPVSVTES